MPKRRSQWEHQTPPYEDRIRWRETPHGGEGESPLGRYVHTRREDGTFDVQFVSRDRWEVIGERLTDGEAYWASVEDNKKRLGITGGGSEPGPTKRRQQDAPVCPKCHTTHPAGDECW
jgi:hypothetical protein